MIEISVLLQKGVENIMLLDETELAVLS